MTTPWKSWILERAPSLTLTCTFRVSPGRKTGISDRICACSSSAIAVCIAAFLNSHHAHACERAEWVCPGAGAGSWPRPVRSGPAAGRLSVCHTFTTERETSLGQYPEIMRIQVRRCLPGRPEADCPGRVAVPCDQARDKVGPGLRRPLDEPGHRPRSAAERVVGRGLGIADDSRQQPADRLDHYQRRGFAAGQHVVTDAHLVDGHRRARVLDDPAVD